MLFSYADVSFFSRLYWVKHISHALRAAPFCLVLMHMFEELGRTNFRLCGVHAVPAASIETSAPEVKPAEDEVKPSVEGAAAPAAEASQAPVAKSHQYSKEPMTTGQLRFLIEKMKNLKKTKNSTFFLKPVDPVLLGIPTYPEIIKNPMDLGTMEQKLKSNKYKTVQEFADDFALIINNTMTFNGPHHAVTQAGMSMEAYFRKMMETVPSSDQQAKAQAKKSSPKPPAPARRESRSAAVTAAPASALPSATATNPACWLYPIPTPPP